ncbi:PQQ-binding-like beta-propeller repeat protein [Salarchaeum sp. III]|uniref:outer membrane protein assembly factor BamB family protein n=1 Tax=Salarchaeum sp. III TaxID=3107927 RepID=UPI002ED93598
MDPTTRRNALRAGALAVVAGFAGCAGDDTSETPTDTTSRVPSTADPTTTHDTPTLQRHAVWSDDLGGEIGLEPAIADGTLYIGRRDGHLAALDPTTGTEKWTTTAGIGFAGFDDASPTTADGLVYVVPGATQGVAGRGFEVVALDVATGDERWSHSVDETSFLSLLGVHDGRVLAATSDDVVGNMDETLVALDATSGRVEWTGTVGNPSGWGIGAGGVYVSSFAALRAVALTDGDTRWTTSRRTVDGVDVTAQTVVTSLERDRGARLRGLDPVSGDTTWRGPDWTVTSHATRDGTVYAGGEQLGAYDADTGAERWSIRGHGFVAEPPIDGRLFARLESGIHARDPDSGKLRWGTNATHDSPLTFGDGFLAYVAASDDPAVPPTLVVRDTATGDATLAVTFDDADALAPPVAHGETLIVATRDGRVHAIRP